MKEVLEQLKDVINFYADERTWMIRPTSEPPAIYKDTDGLRNTDGRLIFGARARLALDLIKELENSLTEKSQKEKSIGQPINH